MSTVVIETSSLEPVPAGFAGRSGVSWAAILAGAFVAAAVSLILLALGGGLEFASISPWPGRGMSGTAFTVYTAIWLIVVQWVSAAVGGYIAGRLRTKWVGTHTHEVFFRDTAHGLIMWSVTAVFVAAALAGSASSLVGGGMHAMANAGPAGGAPNGMSLGEPHGGSAPTGPMSQGMVPGMPPGPSASLTYDIDRLFRPAATGDASGSPATGAGAEATTDSRMEAVYIALHAMSAKAIPESDRTYLAQLVQTQTGVSAQEAQRRVGEFDNAIMNADTKMRAAADAARKAAAEASIYTALSMLIGAFIASVSAALGGRLRDEHP